MLLLYFYVVKLCLEESSRIKKNIDSCVNYHDVKPLQFPSLFVDLGLLFIYLLLINLELTTFEIERNDLVKCLAELEWIESNQIVSLLC